jgi:hypothetical protein
MLASPQRVRRHPHFSQATLPAALRFAGCCLGAPPSHSVRKKSGSEKRCGGRNVPSAGSSIRWQRPLLPVQCAPVPLASNREATGILSQLIERRRGVLPRHPLDRAAAGSGQGVAPLQAMEPREVRIGGTELRSMLDGQGGQVSVGSEISAGAERPEQFAENR